MTFADLSPLANHLWQSTLCVAVAWLLTLALRKNRAAVRFWIWFAASAKFLVPFPLFVSAGRHLTWRAAPVIAGTVLAASLCCAPAVGQTANAGPAFEVASVKIADKVATDRFASAVGAAPDFAIRTALVAGTRGGPGSNDPGRIAYSAFTLRMLMMRAYAVRADAIYGPKWIDTVGYDITAKLPPGTDNGRLMLMVQRLLTERFRVIFHPEKRQTRVYALSVAKDGPKLTVAAPPLPPPSDENQIRNALNEVVKKMAASREAPVTGSRHISLGSATVAGFASALSAFVGIPVQDMTGLDGYYGFALDWTPGAGEPGGMLALDASGPDLYSAVEHQLGLSLRTAKGPVDVLVIDSAEKIPIEN